MYQMILNGTVRQLDSRARFVRDQSNGLTVPCTADLADGILVDGVVYALRGKKAGGRETVDLVETEDVDREAQNSANLDYIAMMTGVNLPEGGV